MKREPIELAPGKLGCPECRYPLEPSLVPVYHEGSKLGAFDGMACEMCGYGLLTEKGRRDKGRALEALDRILASYMLDNAVDMYVTSSVQTCPVTWGDLSVEKTVRSTHAVILPPAVTTLQKSRRVTARLV